MKAVITKRMLAGDEQLEVGDIVDVSNWRNKKALVGARYIKILSEDVVEEKVSKKIEESVEEKPKKKASKAKAE